MALYNLLTSLTNELTDLEKIIRQFAANGPAVASASRFSLEDECFLEGVLSRAWQAWCGFCRGCIVESCLGTIDGAGNSVAQIIAALSEPHVSAAAIKAKPIGAPPPYWGSQNAVLRKEPTWGDPDAFVRIVQRLAPNNQAQLVAAMSAASTFAKDLQIIRNACAHKNHQTVTEVQNIRSRYTVFAITHPTHSLYWIDPNSRDFLICAAMDDLLDNALSAIS